MLPLPQRSTRTYRLFPYTTLFRSGVALHNNYIHDTGGEGIYAGNSFFMGMNTPCGVKLPHEIHYIRIFGNIVRNTGWEAIQLGCATKGASIDRKSTRLNSSH